MLAGLAGSVLPMIAKTVLPALGVGAFSGLASTGVSKVLGNGLYLKKGGCVCYIEQQGNGLYLRPTSGLKQYGEGLYLKQGTRFYDGSGLILGPNSPLKKYSTFGYVVINHNRQ